MTQNYTFDQAAYNIKVVKETARYLFRKSVEASQALVNIIGVTGIAGFQFDIIDEESITLESDITDNYVEDNTSIQDHIVLKPVRLSVRGFVGTFKYAPHPILSATGKITQNLALASAFLPKIENIPQLFKLKEFDNITQGVKLRGNVGEFNLNTLDTFKEFQDLFFVSKPQARAFLFFEALWNSRALFSITTPYKRYDNMCIELVKPIQDGRTKDITDFTVNFKQMRFTQSVTVEAANNAARRQAQIQKEINKGVIKGLEANINSILPKSIRTTS